MDTDTGIPEGMSTDTWDMLHNCWENHTDSPSFQVATQLLDTHRALNAAKAMVDDLRLTAQSCQQLARERQEDLAYIGEQLKKEAVEREWCDIYGDFVDRVNANTSGNWLQRCEVGYTVTAEVTVWVTAGSQDVARATAIEQLRSAENTGYVNGFDITRVDKDE